MTAIDIMKTAAAPTTLWIGVSSVIAGSAAAVAHGNFVLLPALACLIFCIFAQLFSNLTHRYFDDKHGYGENAADGIHYCDDLDRPVSYVLSEAMKVTGIIAAMAGLAILAFAGWWAMVIALVLIVLVVLTNLGPKPLSRTALYPVVTFILFGPIAVIGTCLIQSEASAKNMLSWWDLEPAVIMSIIIGLMAMNGHLIYGAFHVSSKLYSSRTSFFGKYARHAYIVLTVVIVLGYGVCQILVPILMDLRDKPWLYLIVPAISLTLGFVSLRDTLRPGTAHKAWHLGILNMMLAAVLSFIILAIIGYPRGYLDAAPSIF